MRDQSDAETIKAPQREIAWLEDESKRLKSALYFWLPNIPAVETECTERMSNDAGLLVGYDGAIDDGAEKRGWIVLTAHALEDLG